MFVTARLINFEVGKTQKMTVMNFTADKLMLI